MSSLAPGERQILAEIENRLRWSCPALAARLALFRWRAGRGRGPAGESLSPWRARPAKAIWTLVLVVVVTSAILGMGLTAAFGQPGRAASDVRRSSQPPRQPALPHAVTSLAVGLARLDLGRRTLTGTQPTAHAPSVPELSAPLSVAAARAGNRPAGRKSSSSLPRYRATGSCPASLR